MVNYEEQILTLQSQENNPQIMSEVDIDDNKTHSDKCDP